MRIGLFVAVFLIVPLIWCAALAGLRRLLQPAAISHDDKTEKAVMGLMLIPLAAGVAVSCAARLLPLHMPAILSVPPHLPSGTGGAEEAAFAQAPASLYSLPWLAWSIAGIVLAGALVNAVRLIAAHVRLRAMALQAKTAADLGPDIYLTAQRVPPMAWGRASIILPAHLIDQLSVPQLTLVIRHEHEHLRRGDTGWFLRLAWIDAVLWFNPFVRAQTARCRMAAELACDAAATDADPAMRSTYAETLVKVLKASAGNVRQYAPAVISTDKSGDYRVRLQEIMQPDTARRKPKPMALYIAAALLALPLGAAQFAWAQTAAPADYSLAPTDGPLGAGFGPRQSPAAGEARFHEGTDFKVAVGTPVHAVAAGTVSFAGTREGYGLTVEIDHGNDRKTRYAHLQSAAVAVGDKVTPGTVIAASGSSGSSTYPHLHFEVWQDGQAIDPMTVLHLPAK